MDSFLDLVRRFLESPAARAAAIVCAAIVCAVVVRFVLTRVLSIATRRTKTDFDDRLVDALGRPVFLSVLFVGLGYAMHELDAGSRLEFVVFGVLKTIAVLVWGSALMRVAGLLLEALSKLSERATFVQDSTLPLFQITAKILIVGGAVYFAMVSWGIDVTGWLASAGIVGIAVGFAAKDTIANLFAGIFILTDAPYKVGDFVLLDADLRGMVTQIGIRSTRILTRDDIEVTVPNAAIAAGRIVNETSGRTPKRRIRTEVGVAYGVDIDRVREILLECAAGVEFVATDPPPQVRFTAFGDSGLIHELRVWVDEPVWKGRVTDELNRRIYKALNAAGIEIPYAKHDVYIKQMPANPSDA